MNWMKGKFGLTNGCDFGGYARGYEQEKMVDEQEELRWKGATNGSAHDSSSTRITPSPIANHIPGV